MLKETINKRGLHLWLVLVLAACASPKTQQDAKTYVQQAETTLANFMQDPEMTWLQKNIHNAKAVLVSPQVLQAGFVVGGSGGSAVVLARTSEARRWNGPAFYKMATGTIGLQAGAQESEMVALVMTDKGMNSLLSDSFKLGGDVSIAAGPVGKGTAAPIGADMVVYVRSKGVYGGLNLDGTAITVDEKGNQSFYGKPATPVDILVTHAVSNPAGANLARIASRGAASSGAAGSPGSR